MAENLEIGMKCIRYLLFIANSMFVVIGFLLISIGCTITSIYGDFDRFLEAHRFSPAGLTLAVGVITFFIATFGCVSAIKQSTMLINCYSVLLLMILILEILGAIIACAMRSDIVKVIEGNMFSSMKEYEREISSTKSWDFVQEHLVCCGVHKIQDWSLHKINGTEITIHDLTFYVPKTCCNYRNCEVVYESGCLERLIYIITESAFMVETGAICVTVVQVLGIVFGRMLAKSIRRAKTIREIKRQANLRRIIQQNQEKPFPFLYSPKPTRV